MDNKFRFTEEQLLKFIDKCKGDPFLSYGYVRQLEELRKSKDENK